MKKLNKKGFTLVELLTVMVILITILLIAIPSITASLSRSENKQLEAFKQSLAASAKLNLTKSDFNGSYNNFKNGNCKININSEKLKFSKNEKKQIEEKSITGCIGYQDGDLVFIDGNCEPECAMK